MNPTQDLGFFHLLAKQGSLAATARELGVTPPAVSKRLSALEARLGVRLVNRTTRSMSLTAEGELYFAHAARILVQVDEVEQLLGRHRAEPKGLIRVNASLGFGRRYIGPALADFYARYPDIEVQLEISDHPLDRPVMASTWASALAACPTPRSMHARSPPIGACCAPHRCIWTNTARRRS